MARVKIKVSGTKVSLWIRFSFGEKIDIGEYANIMQVKKMMMSQGNPIRLYSLDEITEIFGKLGLRICNSFADFSGKPSSDNDIQLMVYSIRE